MKSAKVVSTVASNKPDGLSIALIIILVLIIVACILWYMLYKPKKEVVPESFEGFCDELNNLKFFQKNNIGKVVPTDPVHVPVDVLEGSLMTADQINAYFGSAKKKNTVVSKQVDDGDAIEHFQNPTIEHFSFGDIFSFGSSKKATPPERTRPTYSDSDSSPPQFSTLSYGPNGPNSYEQKNQDALPNYDKSGELELEKAIMELKGNSGDYKKDVAVAPQRIQPAPVKQNLPTISPDELQKAIIPTVESQPTSTPPPTMMSTPVPKAPSMNCKFLNSSKCHPDYPNFSGASLNFGGDKNKVKCDSVGGEKLAKAVCTIGDGRITGVYMIDEGSGYEVAPKVVVEGGGGSGCKLESEVVDGKLKKIVVKQGGEGFTGTPTVKIESPNMSNGCYLCCK